MKTTGITSAIISAALLIFSAHHGSAQETNLLAVKSDPAALFGPSQSDLQRMIEPSNEIISPHITWSKPGVSAPLRVLFLTNLQGIREVVELRERFDASIDVFSTQASDAFAAIPLVVQNGGAPGWTQEAREARLRDLLSRDYDVIVVGNIRWDILPAWARTAILAKVQAGTGLFGFMPGGLDDGLQAALTQQAAIDPRTEISAFPYAGLPAFRAMGNFDSFAQGAIRFAQDGKGRIALLLVRPPDGSAYSMTGLLGGADGIRVPPTQAVTPEVVDPFPNLYAVHYDYYLALADHLMNWVAQRTPAVRVLEPPLNAQTVQREEPVPVQFALESDGDRPITLESVVRNSESGHIWKQETKSLVLRKGRNDLDLSVTGLPAGSYFVDLWVRDGGDKTIDFGSLLLNIHSSSDIQRLDLASVTFSKSEPVQGTVSLEGAKSGQVLQLTQVDNYGRLVASKTIPVKDGAERVSFRLEGNAPLSVIQTIEARLLDGANVLDLKRAVFTYCDLFPPDDFCCLVAQDSEGNSYLDPILATTLRQAGFDTWITESGENIFSYDDLKDTPYYRFVRPPVRMDAKGIHMGSGLLGNVSTMAAVYQGVDGTYDGIIEPRGNATSSARGFVRQPSLSNAAYLHKCDEFYAGAARDIRKFDVLEYDLGDECSFMGKGKDVSFDDASIRDFQNYLRNHYKTIQDLNEEYGTSYTYWNEVIPIPYDEAKKEGKIPIWIDHRRHMETVWAGYFSRALAAISREIPGARVGYEASDEPGHTDNPIIGGAEDYHLLAHSMTLNGPYYFPLQLDCLRDFSLPGTLIGGGWFGGFEAIWRAGHEALTQHWWIWNTVLRGANSLWVFEGQYNRNDGDYAVLAPDFSTHDFFRPAVEEMRLLRHGIGKLLMSSERPDDGIAVLYSPSSMLLGAFTDGMPERLDSASAVSFVLTEAGFQYRMIASAQLEDGILRSGKYRVLYLPYSQALSPKEVGEILTFAKAGGVVLADLRPAVADAHGKPYPQGALDKLFGVKQDTSKALPVKASIRLREKLGDLAGLLPSARTDGSLRLAEGKAFGQAGDAPAVIVNSFGKGAGVLLNLAFCDYMAGNLTYAPEFSDEAKATATRQLIQAVLSARQIAPAIPITPYIPGVHVFRFGTGESQVLGLVWDAPGFLPGTVWSEHDKQEILAVQSKQVTLDLGTSRYVYDMRTGKYLGQQKTIQRTLSPGTVDLLGTLPYEVKGINLSLPQSTMRQGQPVAYSVSLNARPRPDPSAMHIFHVEFTDPDGNVADHYSLNVKAPGGAYRGTLATSLNEKPGAWKITVKDVQSGVTTTQSFTVKAAD